MSFVDSIRPIAAALLVLLLGASPQAEARSHAATPHFDPSTCTTELVSDALRVDLCTSTNQEPIVFLTLSRPRSPLVIGALFSATFRAPRNSPATKIWRQLWVASGDGTITEQDQLALRRAVLAVGPDHLDPRALALVDFAANFFEAGETVQDFTREDLPGPWALGDLESYTLICDSIGKSREATYSNGANTFRALIPVGDPASACRGRCGAGCWQPLQWRKNQYTQECLNHDFCHDQTGEYLGSCSDAFWKAAYGYLTAPDCDPNPLLPSPSAP